MKKVFKCIFTIAVLIVLLVVWVVLAGVINGPVEYTNPYDDGMTGRSLLSFVFVFIYWPVLYVVYKIAISK
jgi:hypothetical protein